MQTKQQEDETIPCGGRGCNKQIIVGGGEEYQCDYCETISCSTCIRVLLIRDNDEEEVQICDRCYEKQKCQICKFTENGREGILKNCKKCGNLCCRTCIDEKTCVDCIEKSQVQK